MLGGLLLCLLGAAFGAPTITLTATVEDDLKTVRGTLVVSDLERARWVDPLVTLPIPTDELEEARTYPGKAQVGRVLFSLDGDTVTFVTTLPTRFGDIGATKDGLMANGTWYPQPLVADTLPVVDWHVHVDSPAGTVVVVGDQHGAGAVTWQGTADRASLAVVPQAVVTPLQGDGWDIDLVTRRRPRPGLLRNLRDQLPLMVAEGRVWQGTLVEGPLRRRLVRPGAGTAYISDRTWRVFPWFRRVHHRGAARGMAAAWSGHPTSFVRDLTGATFGRLHSERVTKRMQVDVVGLTKWIPLVDAALYTREMAFQHEVLRRTLPSDPTKDDLAERFAPAAPGTMLAAQIADRFGDDTADAFGRLLPLGWSLEQAALRAGVDPTWFGPWQRPYPVQDYTLALKDRTVTVHRSTSSDAPPEAVVLEVDGERHVWEAPGEPSDLVLELDTKPRRVVLDPARHTGQLTRVGDVRPAPIRWTLWGQVSNIDISQATVSALAVVTVRRAADTHNRFQIWAFTDQRAWLSGRFAWTHFLGRLTDPTTRAHQITFGVDASWLNPNFAPDARATASVGGTVAYAWDNRVSRIFPRRGARIALVVSAGGAPGAQQEYFQGRATISTESAPHPRHILASRLTFGYAATDIAQERLAFGGVQGIRGLPDYLVQTTGQGVISLEYRGVPMQQGSIPLALFWLRDIQLIGGVDVGVGASDDGMVAAVGGVAGLGLILDNLGISPGRIGLTFGWPVWEQGFELPGTGLPFQLNLHWGVQF